MQLPRIFYGRYREVKPRLIRVLKRAARGQDWVSLVEQGGFIEVAETDGLIVGNGPDPSLGRREHFQMWFLWETGGGILNHQPTAETMEAFFRESLLRPWSVLGLMMPCNHYWFWGEEHHAPFLRAVSQYWLDFGALGKRYTEGPARANELWDSRTTVSFIFARRGLPLEFLRAPCEPGAFERLLDEHGIAAG